MAALKGKGANKLSVALGTRSEYHWFMCYMENGTKCIGITAHLYCGLSYGRSIASSKPSSPQTAI